VLVAPPNFDAGLVFGFPAGVRGGLEPPPGALVGGVVLGLALSYVSGYAGAETVTLGALVILVGTLMVRPEGLFAHAGTRRV
jgi:branched-chain amino acid transport system permease protein